MTTKLQRRKKINVFDLPDACNSCAATMTEAEKAANPRSGRDLCDACAPGAAVAFAIANPTPESALATIRRHAEAHRALSGSDAYSAQEAPRLEAALADVAELVKRAAAVQRQNDGGHRPIGTRNLMRAALARFGVGS